MTAQEKMTNLVKSQSLEMLKDMAVKLMNEMIDAPAIVHDSVMDELMERMPEQEFINFCNDL